MPIKKNHALLLVKLLFIAAAFALIFWKADIGRISFYLKNVSPFIILLSYVVLTFAQVVSALRTRFYFASVGLELDKKFSIGLYFIGMFFNTILPGGIGGDAYKIYLIHKLKNFPRMKSLRVLLSDRASGLFILLMLLFFLVFFSDVSIVTQYAKIAVLLAVPITILCYFFGIKTFAKELPKTAIFAMPYSFIVQLCGILIVIIILSGLGITSGVEAAFYIILFLISSVLSILPISIGGVGLRELTFMYGAPLLGLNPELGITIGIIYFLVNLLCSMNGLAFWGVRK
jgi:uncharacterized membrane protein YbhN (UPF0104 family)